MTAISLYLDTVYFCSIKIMYQLSNFKPDCIFEIEIITCWMYEGVYFFHSKVLFIRSFSFLYNFSF